VETGRFSLPGAVAKIALRRDNATGRWGQPSGRAATTHILKPPLQGIPNHTENEHLCLALAARLGLQAAASWILRIEDQVALVVERYDRLVRGGVVTRLHQEDVSQALGVNPRLKYATEGAPGIAEIVGLLRDHSTRGLEDVYRFLEAVALNWVIAGTDAHARNYSLLIRPANEVVMAPLYDLASALLLRTRTPVVDLPVAMFVGGGRTLGDITRPAWERQARAVRLNDRRVIDRIRDLVRRMPEAAKTVVAEDNSAAIDERFRSQFVARISTRANACLRELEVSA
jgi:serine/threonine-protein kinase HipA